MLLGRVLLMVALMTGVLVDCASKEEVLARLERKAESAADGARTDTVVYGPVWDSSMVEVDSGSHSGNVTAEGDD